MTDTPTCEHCGTPMDPVWRPEATNLMAWLCTHCGHHDKPRWRESQITYDDWQRRSP